MMIVKWKVERTVRSSESDDDEAMSSDADLTETEVSETLDHERYAKGNEYYLFCDTQKVTSIIFVRMRLSICTCISIMIHTYVCVHLHVTVIIIAYCNRVETEDPLLCPHGQTWKVVERVEIDQAASTKDYCTLFKWSNVQEEKSELDYFLLMYPRQHLSSLLKYTTERLQANSEVPLLEGEY